MEMMSLNKQGNFDTTSIAQDIESLIPTLRQLADRQPESQAYRLLVETVAGELTTIAEQGKSYTDARQVIQSHQHLAALLGSALSEMLTHLEHLEQARIRREKYSLRWWEQTVETLQQAFDKDSEAAYQQWMMIYAHTLVDWELETCSRLVSTQFSYPRDKYPYALLIRHGNASLLNKDYLPTLEMLNYLVSQLSETQAEDPRLLGALLSIFIGRIHFYQMNEPELARQAFDRAAILAPRDGRPLAALGHVSLEQGDNGLAEANRLFSRAVEFSPDQPEGYVGKAIIAEKRELWSEADEWYKTAVQESLDERDVLQFLSKMLAPGSGRLYLHVARQLLADNAPDRALAAIEHYLDLGMDDGSAYPTRSAIALKADILFAKSGPERTPEEVKTIADLYFEAGRYYSWNNEHQTAIDLLKKSHDLDGDNALTLFYLADDLRVLSHIVTPPYADDKLVRESLAAWEAGIKILHTAVNSDMAWIYVARSRIAEQLGNLPKENASEHFWQATLFIERALLLKENPIWWTYLSNTYNSNGLQLYANILYVLQKAISSLPDDIFTLQEYAKVLINTGQFQEARSTLDKLLQIDKVKPESKSVYQSWQAVVDYYQGDYKKALGNLEPALQRAQDDLWTISVRASIYRAMGDDQAAMKDELWIWDRRENQNYQANQHDFAWSAFRQGMFQEAVDRIEPFLDGDGIDRRANAQLLSGLSYLALGNFESANKLLSLAFETYDNPKFLVDLVTELEQLRRRASQERWPLNSAITSYLNEPGSILKLAKSKQKKMKAYKVDPVQELENVMSNPMTGKPGSSSWLATQFGLGRLHLEANRLEAAEKAYLELSLNPQQIPEASIGLKKVQDRR